MTNLSIDLNKIPPADIIKAANHEAELLLLKAKYKEKDPSWNADTESDPVFALLSLAAYYKVQGINQINDGAKAVMVATATGADLENLAAIFNLKREIIIAATEDVAAVYEDDERLRKRVLLAPEGYSNAGSIGAYIFWALTCNKVKDAKIMRFDRRDGYQGVAGADPRVSISLIDFKNIEIVELDVINEVSAILNDDEIRPLTDLLFIEFAFKKLFTIDATLKIYAGASADVVKQKSREQLNEYLDKNYKIGVDITLSGLHAAMTVEGVERVVIISPDADVYVSNVQAAYCAPENIIISSEAANA
ncbi:MAG: baseplate J/gp47 family protein [Rhizobiales bacterium]|nr:baseplate J/gp47 family protein [Hyphomicrobiales bacterium]